MSAMSEFRYDALPVFDAFERVSDPDVYTPIPDDWQVGIADVVRSTDALRDGRYKQVNMAGAAIVGAVKNALGLSQAFPFVFGGDGAVLVVPGEAAEQTRAAMAATANFVRAELGLELRVGMISVEAIRRAGRDMRVARYAASDEAIYAMFSGGGSSYAEEELKTGHIALPPAPLEARPDLTGLSCRFAPVPSRHGVILSVLVAPEPGTAADDFRRVADEVIRLADSEERGGHPVPSEGPELSIHPSSFLLEAGATRRFPGEYLLTLAKVMFRMTVGTLLSRTGLKAGPLDVGHYRTWVTRNSDFRKFDDGLRMTIDCSVGTADALEQYLETAERAQLVRFGLYRQDSALITCFTPSVLSDDHLHFLDGGGGGYALAAEALKIRQGEIGGAATAAS